MRWKLCMGSISYFKSQQSVTSWIFARQFMLIINFLIQWEWQKGRVFNCLLSMLLTLSMNLLASAKYNVLAFHRPFPSGRPLEGISWISLMRDAVWYVISFRNSLFKAFMIVTCSGRVIHYAKFGRHSCAAT